MTTMGDKAGNHLKMLSNLWALRSYLLNKRNMFNVWVRYFVWNFKRHLWNSTQNIPIHCWNASIRLETHNRCHTVSKIRKNIYSVQHISYFLALRSFQMFIGPLFQIKLHLLSTVLLSGFNTTVYNTKPIFTGLAHGKLYKIFNTIYT